MSQTWVEVLNFHTIGSLVLLGPLGLGVGFAQKEWVFSHSVLEQVIYSYVFPGKVTMELNIQTRSVWGLEGGPIKNYTGASGVNQD